MNLLSYSQQKPVKILIYDENKEPLAGAHILLENISTKTQFNTISDASGKAFFQNLPDGLYKLKISFVGYRTIEAFIKVNFSSRYFEYTLKPETLSLNEVTVSATKPVIKQEEDKTIIDPEPIANTSTNTLEVLENTPGLYVDQDGGVYISGTTPAKIYINGKELKLSNQDIGSILRSLPPNSVEKIEIIRSPSTKYDASTTGGIINIVLKKGVNIGEVWNFNIGANQGFMGNRFVNVMFNKSQDKITLYTNVNYSRDGRLEEVNSIRYLKADATLNQESDDRIKADQVYFGYGITYEKNDKLSFSYDGRINFSNRNNVADNLNTITDLNNSILSKSNNETYNNFKFINIQQDFGSTTKLDTAESKWENKIGLNFQNSNNTQDYNTFNIYPMLKDFEGNGNNKQQRFFTVLQSDLTYILPFKIKLETGLKESLQNLISNSKYFYEKDFEEVEDTLKTNKYIFNENIFAYYFQVSKMLIADVTLKTGLRIEYTYMFGKQTIPQEATFKVNRTDLFPYVYLSRQVLDKFGVKLYAYLIYRKSINRPGYQELNPYIRYVDEFMYETGNPSLKPQFTDNIEFNISFNDFPVFAVGKNYTKNVFSNVMYNDIHKPEIFIRTFDNLGKNTETYFRGIVGIPPGGVYFFGLGAQYSMNEYDGIYQNMPLYYKRGSWRFFTFHQLKISKTTKLMLSGFMMTKGMWNFYELQNFGQVNIALNKTFFDQKLQVSISFRDIFKTMITKFNYNLTSIKTSGERYADNQRIGINIRYSFGIKTKEEKKNLLKMEEYDEQKVE
jgi:hypothetical protein